MKTRVNITIEPEQHEWVKKHKTINLSGMVQDMLQKQMEAQI